MVQITSGGTGGPGLDAAYQDLPNNFYASLTGHPPCDEADPEEPTQET